MTPTPPSGAVSTSSLIKSQRSPQPGSAQAARAASTVATADAFAEGLDQQTASKMRSLVTAAKQHIVNGIPKGSLAGENWGFKWAVRFAEAHNKPVLTPHVVKESEKHSWNMFVALMIAWVAPRMTPAPRTAAKGFDRAKPPSALAAAYGYRRVLVECGRYVPNFYMAAKLLAGLIEEYKSDFGDCAMAVDHHIPFPMDSLTRMIAVLLAYGVLTSGWTHALHDAIALAFTFGLARAPRLNEWIRAHAGDTYYKRHNFHWCDASLILGSTAAALAHFGGVIPEGTILRSQNVPMKCDRSGAKFTGRYMWYKKNSKNPLNFATQWQRYETLYPCPEDRRALWAAFSPTGGAEPFSDASARACLNDLMRQVMGAAFAAIHFWHDFRATIASAVIGAGLGAATAQALVCWASAASAELYGQMVPAKMADVAEVATNVDAERHAHLPRPHMCVEDLVRDMSECQLGLESEQDQHTGTKAKRPVAATTPTATPSRQSVFTPSEHDVGAPHNVLVISTASAFDGAEIDIADNEWPGHPGGDTTRCVIVGFSKSANLYVVRASDDNNEYAFTPEVITAYINSSKRRSKKGRA